LCRFVLVFVGQVQQDVFPCVGDACEGDLSHLEFESLIDVELGGKVDDLLGHWRRLLDAGFVGGKQPGGCC